MGDISLASSASPLRIWAVSDGRAGIEAQVLGLTEAIASLTPATIDTRHIRYAPFFNALPTALKLWPDAMLAPDSDRIAVSSPDLWPDIFIAAGRATLPHSMRMKHRSGGKTFVVQLQDPKERLSAFDLVIAPQHDGLSGPNIMSVLGSTHRVTPQKLSEAAAQWAGTLSTPPRPHIAVLIGGRSKVHDLSPARAQNMASDIRKAVDGCGGSLLLTLSRRTPQSAQALFTDVLKDLPGILYTGQGPNPYFAFLGTADHILVTEDSVNMVTEAATTGKPVHILAMDRLRPSPKFDAFHRGLKDRGITRAFTPDLQTWAYEPLNETQRAAHAVLTRYAEFRADARIGG